MIKMFQFRSIDIELDDFKNSPKNRRKIRANFGDDVRVTVDGDKIYINDDLQPVNKTYTGKGR